MMTIDEARTILKNGTESYGDFVEASAVVYGEYVKRAHPGTRFVMDAKMPVRDQTEYLGPGDETLKGADLVSELDGPASSYFISINPGDPESRAVPLPPPATRSRSRQQRHRHKRRPRHHRPAACSRTVVTLPHGQASS